MKQSLTRPRLSKLSGFTLVELLVVIGIIAILAGVLLSAGGTAIKASLRLKAANTAGQIQTACMNYFTEYSVYPVPNTVNGTDYTIQDTAIRAADWGVLVEALSGNIKPSTGLAAPAGLAISNTRGIAFLSLKAADVDTHDAPKNPLPPDPVNHIYFNIAMDSDYDGILGTLPPTSAIMPNFATGTVTNLALTGGTSTAGIAVWANCTTKPDNPACNAGWWVHTY